jgi:hypothetical protein
MGWLRKKAKQIGRAIKKVGKKFKKAFGKVAKAFGKLGPLGSIAMSFLLPGIGNLMSGWIGSFGKGVMNLLPKGASEFLSGAAKYIRNNAIRPVTGKISQVFDSITGALNAGFEGAKNVIETGVNKLGGVVGKEELGTDIRNYFANLKPSKTAETPKVTDVDKDFVGPMPKPEGGDFVGPPKPKVVADAVDLKEKYGDEISAYKKIKAVGTFGQDIQAQEDYAEAMKEQADARQRAYFTSIGEQALGQRSDLTLSGQPIGFIDSSQFNVNEGIDKVASLYSNIVLNAPVPVGMNPLKFINNFAPIGPSLEELLGLQE